MVCGTRFKICPRQDALCSNDSSHLSVFVQEVARLRDRNSNCSFAFVKRQGNQVSNCVEKVASNLISIVWIG